MAYSAPGPRRAGRIVGWLVALGVLGLLAALIATIVVWIGRWNPPIPAPVLPAEGCMVTVEGFTTTLTQEQSVNASIIVGESIRRGLPARAATIALVTAYQESDLRNLDYGDRDSIGLFQQRPSQGWGTVEEIMDPWYSAGKFYEHLVLVPGWESDVINDVAQAVQRSGHPDYAQHEGEGPRVGQRPDRLLPRHRDRRRRVPRTPPHSPISWQPCGGRTLWPTPSS